jgi:hypothetical protein
MKDLHDFIPRSVPRLLFKNDAERVIVEDYNGVNLASYLPTPLIKNSQTHLICDILLQASFIIAALATKCNVENQDLHDRNLVITDLPYSSIRRVCLFRGVEHAYVEYSSNRLVTAIDFGNSGPFAPYQQRPSSQKSSSSSNKRSSRPCVAWFFSLLLSY